MRSMSMKRKFTPNAALLALALLAAMATPAAAHGATRVSPALTPQASGSHPASGLTAAADRPPRGGPDPDQSRRAAPR